jgi:hypothetical protein
MAKEKSLVEEAIIQMKNLEEAVAENAKGILASTMSQEIKELVKESLTEQDDEEIDTEVDMDDMEMDTDMDDTEMDDVDVDMDMEDDMDTDNMDMDMDDEDTIDLTDVEDDEEILRVFQLMGPEDNIVVTKDDSGNISLKDEENNKEYMIVGEGEEEEEEMFEQFDDEFEFEDEEEDDMDDDDSEGIEDIISRVFDNDDEDSEMDEEWGGNKHDFKRRKGHKIGDVDGHFKDFESEFDEEEEMDDEEIVYEISFDDEEEVDMDLEEQEDMDMEIEEQDDMDMDMEDDTMMESKMSVNRKGIGFGNANKKKVYSNKPNQEGGFKTVKKSVNPTMGTGKAKFDYKDGENLDGKMKSVKKTETKEQTTKIANTTKKVEPKEASRTLGNGSNFRRGGLPKPRAHSSFNTAIKENQNTSELKVLREKNEEYRKALNVFRNKLNEVAVFNSNLAYATRLFTEHSTSKQEKINILRRFDGVENIKESKNLYKVIKDELTGTTSQPMNESLERTIAKAPSTGSAVNLIESKTYENPQFLRMKDLMSKLK